MSQSMSVAPSRQHSAEGRMPSGGTHRIHAGQPCDLDPHVPLPSVAPVLAQRRLEEGMGSWRSRRQPRTRDSLARSPGILAQRLTYPEPVTWRALGRFSNLSTRGIFDASSRTMRLICCGMEFCGFGPRKSSRATARVIRSRNTGSTAGRRGGGENRCLRLRRSSAGQ
jgi:hypothetical protein